MASTELDVYRPFTGRRGLPRAAWWTIGMAGVRGGLRSKLALFLLYLPIGIGTVVVSVIVYVKFSLEAGLTPGAAELGPQASLIGMIGSRASQMVEMRNIVAAFNVWMSAFAIVPVGWYGAGLLAEDRRLGAHLLYFSRPIGRLDYLAGKLLTVSVFGAFATLVPVTVVFTVAAFVSPDWAFVRLEGDVIANGLLYAVVWTLTAGSIVLGVSSLCERKSFAVVAFFGLLMITTAVSLALSALQQDGRWMALSVLGNLGRLAQELFAGPASQEFAAWPEWWSWATLSGMAALSGLVAWRRVRRMEVVA
jgi:hypothetical protein